MNARCCEFFLQIISESQIDRGSKRNGLGGCWPCPLANISAAQGLRRSAILDDKHQWIILVVNDLLVFQQLEKAVVRYVFEGLHPAAEIKHREGDTPEADRQKDDAAPIEIGLIAAGFILSLRVTVGFWHKGTVS